MTNNDAPTLDGNISIPASSRVRGIATSGWRGRSLSMGVADSVTVLAADAAAADAAATMIANATDVAHPAVKTAPARSVRDDTDLGERMVTVDVGPLDDAAINIALTAGTREAEIHRSRKLIVGACISLQGHQRCIDGLDEMERQAS